MSELGHFRRFARVPDWSGVPQEPDVPGAIRRFGVASISGHIFIEGARTR
jgi:hypothetical protein